MRPKENEIIDKLSTQTDWCQPLVPGQVIRKSALTANYEIDAVIEFSIPEGPSFRAAVELLTISTPKAISLKCNVLKNSLSEFRKNKLVPMIIAPYISEKQSKVLSDEGISWIDLSGNMLLNIPPDSVLCLNCDTKFIASTNNIAATKSVNFAISQSCSKNQTIY